MLDDDAKVSARKLLEKWRPKVLEQAQAQAQAQAQTNGSQTVAVKAE